MSRIFHFDFTRFSVTLSGVLLMATLFSQNSYVGVKSGIAFSNVISQNFLTGNKQRIGVIEGASYDYFFGKHFILGTEANYEQRGFMNYITFTDANGNLTGRKEPFYYQYDYMTLPLKLDYTTGNKFFVLAGIGITPAFILKAVLKTPVFDQNFNVVGQDKTNMANNISKFDCAGFAEIGGGSMVKEKFSVNVSFRYQRSFTSMTNDNYFPSSKIYHVTMLPSIGIKYLLTKAKSN